MAEGAWVVEIMIFCGIGDDCRAWRRRNATGRGAFSVVRHTVGQVFRLNRSGEEWPGAKNPDDFCAPYRLRPRASPLLLRKARYLRIGRGVLEPGCTEAFFTIRPRSSELSHGAARSRCQNMRAYAGNTMIDLLRRIPWRISWAAR